MGWHLTTLFSSKHFNNKYNYNATAMWQNCRNIFQEIYHVLVSYIWLRLPWLLPLLGRRWESICIRQSCHERRLWWCKCLSFPLSSPLPSDTIKRWQSVSLQSFIPQCDIYLFYNCLSNLQERYLSLQALWSQCFFYLRVSRFTFHS